MSQASTNDTTHEVTSSYSSGDLEVQQTTNQMFVDNPEIADSEFIFSVMSFFFFCIPQIKNMVQVISTPMSNKKVTFRVVLNLETHLQ